MRPYQGRYGPLTELACPSVAPSCKSNTLLSGCSCLTNTNSDRRTDRQTDATSCEVPEFTFRSHQDRHLRLRWPRLGFVEANAVSSSDGATPVQHRTFNLSTKRYLRQNIIDILRHICMKVPEQRACVCLCEGTLTGRVLLRLLCFDSSVSCSSDLKTPRARQPIRLKLSPLATPFRITTQPHVRSIWSVEGATGAEWRRPATTLALVFVNIGDIVTLYYCVVVWKSVDQ